MFSKTLQQTIHPSTLFSLSVFAFLLGVAWESYFPGDIITKSLMFGLFLAFVLGVFQDRKVSLLTGLLIAVSLIGIWRTDVALQWTEDTSLIGKQVEVEGVISREPISTKNGWRIYIKLDKCENLDCIGEKTMLSVDKWADYAYGDRLRFSCEFAHPENFTDDFDWRRYLNKERVRYVCNERKPEIMAHDRGSWLYARIIDMRKAMEYNVDRFLVQPHAALGNGLLFGGDGRLSEEMQTAFSETSMTHIVAVSGYNVTILAAFFIALGLAIGLWRQQAFWFALFGVVLFVVMIGYPASAVRAGVMGSIVLIAMRVGRKSSGVNALFLAAAIMALINPLIIRYDVGFQLSFMATLGILIFIPLIEDKLPIVSRIGEIGQIFLATISAQLFTIPILAINFHQISLISTLVNILVLWIIPFTMIAVFAVAVLGFISDIIATPFAWIAYGMLEYEIEVVKYFAQFDWGLMQVSGLGWGFTLLWYGALFGILWRWKQKRR